MSRRMTVLQSVVVKIAARMESVESVVSAGRRSTAVSERAFRLARGVRVSRSWVAGVQVRRYTSGSTSAAGTEGVVLHLHGGAYFCGSSRMAHRYSAIVADGGPDMVSVDYRLAPEHPYPAALDDALAVYRELSSVPIAVVGDSAGGGLALALAQRVRDEGLPLPVALAPLFPWADLTQSGSSYALNAGRDILTKAGLDRTAEMYCAGRDPLTPGISPLFGTFDQFPPTLITVGEHDSLLEDSRRLAAALRDAGADVTLRETTGAIHGFTTLPMPEAAAAIAAISSFLRRHLEAQRAAP